jgi:hypothetical protein
LTAGRNLRAIIAAHQQYNQTSITTASNRRRRQSWHDVNEYHSVPYYQYTYPNHTGFQRSIQCDMDNEQLRSKLEALSDVEEEIVNENKIKNVKQEYVKQTTHHLTVPQDRAKVLITTHTE